MAVEGGWECHPTAVIEEGATLGEGVVLGPYATVGRYVTLGAGTHIGAHSVSFSYRIDRGGVSGGVRHHAINDFLHYPTSNRLT